MCVQSIRNELTQFQQRVYEYRDEIAKLDDELKLIKVAYFQMKQEQSRLGSARGSSTTLSLANQAAIMVMGGGGGGGGGGGMTGGGPTSSSSALNQPRPDSSNGGGGLAPLSSSVVTGGG